jgi:hypothetical protein
MKTAITLRRLAVAALTATTIGVGPVDHIVDAGRSGSEVPGRIDVEDGNKVFVGDVAEIPYTADYYFWKSTGS